MEHGVALPLLVAAAAGLATGLGGVIATLAKRTRRSLLAGGLGMSGGAMVYVSFVELLPSAAAQVGEATPGPWTLTAFFAGVATIALIDWLVPSADNPHDAVLIEDLEGEAGNLQRMGLLSALAIGVHNVPEGVATFYSTVHDPTVGVAVGAAIGLHNLPEGFAVALPIYYATGSRARALGFAALSGLAEPLGALLAYLAFGQHLGDRGMAALMAAVAGVMVFLALDQLLPNAKRYGVGHESVYGLVVGMLIMAVTLSWLL